MRPVREANQGHQDNQQTKHYCLNSGTGTRQQTTTPQALSMNKPSMSQPSRAGATMRAAAAVSCHQHPGQTDIEREHGVQR